VTSIFLGIHSNDLITHIPEKATNKLPTIHREYFKGEEVNRYNPETQMDVSIFFSSSSTKKDYLSNKHIRIITL
jgi:hypothetical protein